MKHTFISNKKSLLVIAFAVVVVVVACVGIFVWRHSQTGDLNKVSVITARVNKHYVLPTDEQPALATVTNKNKLTSAFLKKAENGDKVLIYQKNSIAIIYRPSIDRIIAVGPVQIDTPPSAVTPVVP